MKRVRVSTAVPSLLPPAGQVRFARFLEALGFDGLWLPDHLLFPEGAPAYDSWTVLAAMAQATKRVTLGPAVTDPHRLHPAVMAQKLATLDSLSNGRMILGLGSGEAMNLEPYGIEWRSRTVRKMSEFVQVVRGLLDSREPVDFEGDFFQLHRAKITARRDRRHLPIYFAALGPMMQKLCGKRADGWMPTHLPARAYRDYFEPIAESARKHGRDPEELERIATVVVSIDTDGKVSTESVRDYLRPLAGALVWPPVMQRLGYEFSPPPEAQSSYMEVNPCDPDSLAKYWNLQDWLPEDMISEALVHGDCEHVYQECRKFIDAGSNHLYIFFGSLDPIGSYLMFAKEVLPRLTGKRPTMFSSLLGGALGPLIRGGIVRRRFPAPPMRMPGKD